MQNIQKEKSLWQIINMCVGFFGIQFGWGLQMANMSAIYNRLGAEESAIPLLWLAAPVTGLLVQPFIGYFSDKTWCKLGRRRPYFLAGALLATLALFVMPNSTALWMAAVTLWVLDASVNVSMEPFRAFVGDILPAQQRKVGYAMQSLMIGAGAVIASSLPWLFSKLGVSAIAAHGAIPDTIKYSFYIGGIVFIAAVLYTIITTPEYPPADMEEFKREAAKVKKPLIVFKEIFDGLFQMPKTMKQLAWVQFFTWTAFFIMWVYFGVGITKAFFDTVPGSALYEEGIAWGGVCFATYNGVAFAFAFMLIWLTKKFSAKKIHIVCLSIGGLGLASLGLGTLGISFTKTALILPMVGVGIAWASILSMPYAILSTSIPSEKMGLYMGIFNFFIVLPQIVASALFGYIMKYALGGSAILSVACGGIFLIIAALLTLRVNEQH